MIDSEGPTIPNLLCFSTSPSSQVIPTFVEASKFRDNGILACLSVSQSNVLEIQEQKACLSPEGKNQVISLRCRSCQAWEQWNEQSQQTMLKLEKLLISRQKQLHEYINSLKLVIQTQTSTYRELRDQYEAEKSKNQKTIKQLESRIDEFKSFPYGNLKKMILRAEQTQKLGNCFKIQGVVRQEDDQQSDDGYYISLENSQAFQGNMPKDSNKTIQNIPTAHTSNSSSMNYIRTTFQDQQTSMIPRNTEDENNTAGICCHSPKQIKQKSGDKIKSNQNCQVAQHEKKTVKMNKILTNAQRNHLANTAISQCNFVQNTPIKRSNIFEKDRYDERTTLISRSDDQTRLVRTKNPEIFNVELDGRKVSEEMLEQIRKLQFENDNLKSYNRVLLEKLSNSRPRKY